MSIIEHTEVTPSPTTDGVLTPGAIAFVAKLERTFRAQRSALLELRRERLARVANGGALRLPTLGGAVRKQQWQVHDRPEASATVTVDVFAPTDPALGLAMVSGLRLCIADCSLADDWREVLAGHAALRGAKTRQSNRTAMTAVRTRSFDSDEPNVLVDGQPISAALFDFGVTVYHASKSPGETTTQRFELAGLESHLEARLWADVFAFAANELAISRNRLRAIIAIETEPALFELDEMLFELRDFGAALRSIGSSTQAALVTAVTERRGSLVIEPIVDLTSASTAPTKIATKS